MDYWRPFLVPFHPTTLLMVGIFAVLITLFASAGFYGLFAILFVQIWLFKYCYVLIEHLADGAHEPPVMDTDMLSPLETRPWIQAAWLFGGGWLAWKTGGVPGAIIGTLVLALLPATVALLGFGERALQTVNPLAWYRVVRGLGPFYLLLLAALGFVAAVSALLARLQLWSLIEIAVALWMEVAFFALVGACLYVRRKPLGYVPSRSPERAAARADAEHFKRRARMIDEVFQKVRIGQHVDATQPLALWLKDPDNDAERVAQDAFFIVEQAIRWDNLAALNPIGSTLIRHLLRYGRADAALSIFQLLKERSADFTMDSAHDLRTLADYAEGSGREELAQSMRLETPVFQPPR